MNVDIGQPDFALNPPSPVPKESLAMPLAAHGTQHTQLWNLKYEMHNEHKAQ